MTPELWRKIAQALDELLELDAPQQDKRLEELRQADAAVAREVESLLGQQKSAHGPDWDAVAARLRGNLQGVEQPRPVENYGPGAETVDHPGGRKPDPGSGEETVPARERLADLGGETLSGKSLPSAAGYEILGVLGQGGMGKVYKARHLRLDRVVALKMIPSGFEASREELARFRVEVRALASLHHPHIVQIYEVHEDLDYPCFSLELMEGGSLQKKLAGTPQPPRAAALLAEVVARAMHVAHQHGIVHRDLKPGNILLDGDGQPKITDFGLAKRVEASEGLTVTGAILGTPSYMAPEQATGKGKDAGPAVDIYALGAILYECLTGRPPFRGPTLLETVQQVIDEEPVPVRRLQPTTPRDLETICLKCLHKDAARRYASAEHLAEDLRRFLNGESILARPVGPLERLTKWARRRPALAALVLVSVIAFAALLVLWGYFTVNLRDQRNLAQAASRRAEANFQRAMQAVDQMLTEVADAQVHEPRMEKKRRALLEKALAFYQDFLQEKSADLEVRKKAGLAYKRVADLQRLLGQFDRAEDSYRSAITLLEELGAELPGHAEYRHLLADSLNWQGELQRLASRPQQAEASLEEARGHQESLAREYPDQPAYRKDLARTHMNLGLVRRVTNRRDEAIASFRAAIAILDELTARHPKMASFQQELARCLLNLGPVLRVAGKETEAEAAYGRAVVLLEQLLKQAPRSADYRFELAMVLHNRGNFHAQRKDSPSSSGHLALAEADLGRARELFEKLVADFPAAPLYRQEQANMHNSLGDMRVRQKDFAGAAAAWTQTRASLEVLVGEFPQTAGYRGDLGMVLGNLGWLRGKEEQWAQSRDLLLEAVPHVQEALKPNPNDPDFLRALRNIRRDLASAYLHLEDHAAAAQTALLVPEARRLKEDYLLAASLLARCVPLAKSDAEARDRYTRQALDFLQQAVALGFRNAKQLQGDAAFGPLRTHPDFVAILAKMQ